MSMKDRTSREVKAGFGIQLRSARSNSIRKMARDGVMNTTTKASDRQRNREKYFERERRERERWYMRGTSVSARDTLKQKKLTSPTESLSCRKRIVVQSMLLEVPNFRRGAVQRQKLVSQPFFRKQQLHTISPHRVLTTYIVNDAFIAGVIAKLPTKADMY
jgi:hypothetical protein